MSIFIKTINNLLSGNLDKIGKNLNFDPFCFNNNNYDIVSENIVEFNAFNIDTPPTGIVYNIKQITANDDMRNYFYTCLNLALTESQIQDLTNIEEYLYFKSSENSTSKLANLNEYILDKFFIKNNETDFESIEEIKDYTIGNVINYLSMLKEICIDDHALYRFIPNIFSLLSELTCY